MISFRRVAVGFFILFIKFQWIFGSIFDQTSKSHCQPIDIPLCKDIPYNQTIFPNPIFPHDQQSLQSQVEHFKPLIKTKCNPHIKFFICSVFAPMCPDQLPQAVTSCRSVCEEVKRDCIKILQEFDIQWPAPLNCSKFPEGPDLCMRPQEDTRLPPIETDPHSHLPDSRHLEIYKMKTYPSCPVDLIDLDPTDKNGTCAFRCNKDTMFTKDSKLYAQYWMFLLSIINISIISFTVLSFLIDHQRFQFPERSILYIALCYLLYSLPYLIRSSFLSHEQTSCERIRLTERHFFVHGGLDNTICVVSFLFSYYFTIAGSIWWLMLTFTWYLSAAQKWVQEEIEKRATYLHLAAWGIPCILTILVLIMQKVDASELTGVCSVGNTDPLAVLSFVVAPKAIILGLGFTLLISGFISMGRERHCFKQRGTDTSKLEKLMYKMGIFTVLYIIPAMVILACDGYHVYILQKWYPATIACKRFGGADKGMCRRPPQPQALYYIINLSLSLTIGLATTMWIISTKTLKAWQRLLCCNGCKGPNTQKYHTAMITTSTAPHHHQHHHHPSVSGVNGSLGSNNGPQSRYPLIPPSRNPPPAPPPTSSHYIPLSVMTASGGGNNCASVTYTGSNDWKSSKIV